MTLEEFLTSTEMQNGITTPSQVEELITLIQEEKDCDLKSFAEATRKHSAVARAVADTGNKSCLDLFINLGGLLYINRWLSDALKPGNDASGDLIKESLSSQFRALEKLHIDNEKLISSGIWATVNNLCEHDCSSIKDKARELLLTWKDADASVNDVQKVDSFSDDEGARSIVEPDKESTLLELAAAETKEKGNAEKNFEATDEDAPESTDVDADEESTLLELSAAETKEKGNAEKNLEATDEDAPEAEGSESQQLVKVKDAVTEAPDSQIVAPVSLDHADVEGTTSAVSETEKNIRCCPATPATRSLDSSLDIQVDNPRAHKEITENGNLTDVVCNTSEDQEPVNNRVDLIPEETGNCSSGAKDTITEQAVLEPTVQEIMDSEEGAPQKYGFVKDTNIIVSERSGGLDDPGLERSLVRVSVEERSDGLDDPGHQKSPMMETIEETSSRLEELKTDYDLGLSSQMDEDYSKGSAIQNLARDSKTSKISNKSSDINMDYGIMDALEVARQVAKAVEREVVDNKSSFCGSASDNKSDMSGNPGNTGSIDAEGTAPGELSEESSTKSDTSSEASSDREVEVSSSENVQNGPVAMQDVNQLAEQAQDNQSNVKKDMCEFDLNEEVPCENLELLVPCSRTGDDNGELMTNHPTATMAPNASCSRSSTVSAFPIGTSQFVGSLGWKGSASTSAFHQPSPHIVGDSHDMHPCGPTSCSPKQKPDVFCIDLNVAEEDDRNAVLLPENEITSSSKILNKQPCAAAFPRTSERPEFDLNMASDVDDAPSSSSLRKEKQHFSHLNGRFSDSPASSSSSIQPWMNIDLNDGPSIQSMPSRLHPFFGMSATQNVDGRGAATQVISIMGAQVEVSRNSSFIEPLSLTNGRNDKHGIEANMANFLGVGPSGSHANSFPYSHSNVSMGPAPAFPSPMFRPGNTMSYMSDPRVGMLLQTGSSSSAVPPIFSQPPFYVSMPGPPPPGLNGFARSRPNIDLNLGVFMTDGGNREGMATRQHFINNNQGGGFVGEHQNANSRPSSSFGKRKEPESGWENYPYNPKHHHYPPGNT